MKQSIRTRAMRRVIAVYYLRKVLNMATLKLGLLGLTTLAFASLVHVAAVFSNMPSITDIPRFVSFSTSAFLATELMVQGIVIALGVIAFWLVKDVFKAASMPQMKLSYA